MIKALFFLLSMLWGGQPAPPQTAYNNPMDGFILHTWSEHGKTYAQTIERTIAEEEDSKSDSDDSDDEFDPLVFPKIWALRADNNLGIHQKIGKEQVGELCSAFLPPILSPPDENAYFI
jgi:hypothetical protein